MIAPALLNLVKTSLKSLYDIDPLVVEHMIFSARMQALAVGNRSATLLQHAQRAVRDNFSAQPIGSFA
ncbi:MAG: hypothetical protein EOP52_12660 [Sphingobacteriales bacterium]|nr:MAG: hypothetical protein EOP52_12660 [Sphingobacteriales bacterium]